MSEGIPESRFYMWRAVFAMAHADHVITDEERACSTNFLVGQAPAQVVNLEAAVSTRRAARPAVSGVARVWVLSVGMMVLALALLPNLSVVLTSISATGAWYRSLVPREFTSQHYWSALNDQLVMPSMEQGAVQLGIEPPRAAVSQRVAVPLVCCAGRPRLLWPAASPPSGSTVANTCAEDRTRAWRYFPLSHSHGVPRSRSGGPIVHRIDRACRLPLHD